MGESILQLRQIRKSFDNTEVLKGIDLEVAQENLLPCWELLAAARPRRCVLLRGWNCRRKVLLLDEPLDEPHWI